MGYILNGKYYRGDKPDMRVVQNTTYKQHDHRRQRLDNAREIIQPRNRDGSPNEHFLQAYPEEAKEYGFLPTDDQLKEL
jgi:hypothetical protein